MSEIESTVFAVIARTAAVDVSTIGPGSTIKELAIASLDVIEMLFELEEHFDVQLSDREINFATASAADLIAAIESGLAAKVPKLVVVHPA